MPIIEAQNLTKQVVSPEGPLTILDDVSFALDAGEACAIVGASGSGKSTLLGLLAGLDVPTRGRVLLDGVDLGALDEDGRARLRAGRVGFIFQSFQLLAGLSALENVMLPLELAGKSDAPPRRATCSGMWVLPTGSRITPASFPAASSSASPLRAFGAPSILFADEPTGSLDQATGARVIELLFALNREQATTLVLVTHDEALADYCKRRVRLDAGRLRE